jgi:hypothetical protein
LRWEKYVRRELEVLCKVPEILAGFSSKQVSLIEERHKFDALKIYTLIHAVLNKILLGFISTTPNMYLLIYESLCSNPASELERCYEFVGLKLRNEDRYRHESLTKDRSAEEDANPYSTFRNSEDMANIWKRRLTQKQVDEVRTLWTEFEIEYYTEEPQWQLADV